MVQSTSSIAFKSGFYDTVVVKSWKLLPSHVEIVCEYYLNHFLPVEDKSGENKFA